MSDNLDDVRQPLGKTLNRSCTTQYRGVSKHSRVWGAVKSDIGICKKLEDTITKYCDLYITHQVEFPGRTFGYGFCENMDQAESSRGLLEPSETPETLRLQARSPQLSHKSQNEALGPKPRNPKPDTPKTHKPRVQPEPVGSDCCRLRRFRALALIRI